MVGEMGNERGNERGVEKREGRGDWMSRGRMQENVGGGKEEEYEWRKGDGDDGEGRWERERGNEEGGLKREGKGE